MRRFLAWFDAADRWLTRRRMIPRPRITNRGDLKSLARVGRAIWVLGWCVFAAVIVVGAIYYAFIYFGPATPLIDPKHQLEVPPAKPTLVARTVNDPWNSEVYAWMTAEEARGLRAKNNVINLAILSGGNVKYSRDRTYNFTSGSPWQRSKPFGMQELSVTGTAVQFSLDGSTYNLNCLQPFVRRSEPNLVYVVDTKGQLWEANLDSLQASPVDQLKLPLVIMPNQNLSFSY